jgi:hypothetical protein
LRIEVVAQIKRVSAEAEAGMKRIKVTGQGRAGTTGVCVWSGTGPSSSLLGRQLTADNAIGVSTRKTYLQLVSLDRIAFEPEAVQQIREHQELFGVNLDEVKADELGVVTGSAMLKDETRCIRCGL